MAHKKGVGSSKNGRESESKRLGVKILVVKLLLLGTSSRQEVQNIIQVLMFTSVKITHSHARVDGVVFSKEKR
jgi:hypothetical protein